MQRPSQQLFLEGGGVFYHAEANAWYLTSGRNGCMDPRGGDVRVWRAPAALGPYAYCGDAAPLNGSGSTQGPTRGWSPTRAQQFGFAVVNGVTLYLNNR